jgi:glutathione S-transferase
VQLFINNASPYSRVVRIVTLEKGLSDEVQLVWSDPWSNEPALMASNPASRVPALVTQEGVSITESLMIAYYLDSLSNHVRLLSQENLPHALHLIGLGQGLMEAAFNNVIVKRFEGAAGNDTFFGRRREEVIRRTLIALDADVREGPQDLFTLGEIVVGVALAYIDFRMRDNNWRRKFPSLVDLLERVSLRESFNLTAFG